MEEVRYSREQLVTGGVAFLNVQPMYVAGALEQEPHRKTFTVAEAEDLVKDYMKRETAPDDGTVVS